MQGISERTNEMHKKAAAALPETGSMRKALRAAGASQSTADTQAGRTFDAIARNPEAQALLQMSAKRISDQRLAEKLSDLLDHADIAVDKKGNVIECPDGHVQLKTAEVCLRLRGLLKDDREFKAVLVMVVREMAPMFAPFIDPTKRGEFMRLLEDMSSGQGSN